MWKKLRNMGVVLFIIFFISSILPVNKQVVLASSTDDSKKATREQNISQILSTNPENAKEPNTSKPSVPNANYSKDISFSQTTLKGIYSSKDLFFYVPDYWDTKYVYAQIQYDVSELMEGLSSSMTFSINNRPIESCAISYNKGNTQIVYVKIPRSLVKKGYNSLTISGYAKLYDEEGCMDDFSGANWMSIDDTSFIRCGYDIKNTNHMIAEYPYPFMSTTEASGKGLTIAVSDKATDGEVAAAMNLMSDLSSKTENKNDIQFSLLSDIEKTNPNRTILISDYENLPSEYKSKITDSSNLSKYATVAFVDDSKGNPLLIITSKKDECLLEAAYMLMDEDRVSQEKTSIAKVKYGSKDIAMNSKTLSKMVAGNYTIKDIMGSGMTFVGPFHQEQNIFLPFSEDYFLSDAGKVTLNFRYSNNLDFNRSMITVYWGNVPVASKKLTKSKASGDELTFVMPEDVVGTTTGSIKIAFDLELKDLVCTPRQDEMPWAYVSEDSTLFLPASTGIVLTFDLKPSPFRTDGKFNDLMMLISDKPTSDELNLLAQIIGMYGQGVDPYGTFCVKRESEFSKKDSDYNIITAGTYNDNKVIKSMNNKLHFSYTKDGNKFNSNEQLILSDSYAGEIAIMQLLESPFANNRGVLAITATNKDSLSYVDKFMRSSKKRLSLSKDCAIIDHDLKLKTYQFINKVDKVKEPTVIGTLMQHKQSLLFTIISTSVMVMLLIAVIIILIRIRMYYQKNGKEDDKN
ncbi:cellulose biosynthesis cyclic di-GMP-binding regulatory protein BcsB [Anaeromicropila herbilytica]|uniref:Cellulose synthase n=1 Tax=Anaeromicropila herbilytica TaxID=2785025 RepID=A0A7R7EJV0_9FIRM|nr:cellulose biosynthesis cyclic di-GMP-binding regulatory protein BcsB [Anaeromicropila herbilytica]BCN29941.1 cellulose synthase [Anaeromicropila herbilytica]